MATEWDLSSPKGWDQIYWEGRRLIQNYLDMPVPMIAAINGPALVHAELGALCDVVLAADTVEFQDAAHFKHHGAVPGDGAHLVWPLLALRYTRVALGMMLKNLLADSLSHGLALEGLGVIENQRSKA